MNYYKRGFLNKDEGMAAFDCQVSIETFQGERPYINAGFTISDCSRQISLDFDVSDYNGDSYEQASHKLTTLICELIVFEKKLMQAKIEFDIAKAANEASGTETT